MKQLITFIVLLFLGLSANAQDNQALRNSLMQYQFNALPLNPAYAGRLEATSFEAFYYGSFSSKQQVSRSAMLSLHGRGGTKQNLGWGGVLQFHNQAYFNELNFRPAFSRIFHFDNSQLSFGATLGVNYIDVDESIASNLTNSFFTFNGGAGAFWHNQRTFLGLSAPNFFEKTTGAKESISDRERSVNLHAGSVFPITDDYYIKPTILLRRTTTDIYDNQKELLEVTTNAADIHASLFVEGSYVIGVLAGVSKLDIGPKQTRLGISAVLLFDNFRFGYALQYNRQAVSSISLPATHTISAGYDFFENPEDARRVF